ncbi:class I SAM-dependent methyltransferase [Nocardia sp. CA-135953]|uniref:class I SAM-dependent methyltransferase n=1 Tax=Nocardia sp. CA-135953 TaxID=3239978 RepID=UPI003D99DDF3
MRTDYDTAGYAERYARSRRLDGPLRALWVRILANAIPASEVGTVLDLGAGIGRFWPIIQEAWDPEIIVAVDSSAEMLRTGGAYPGVSRVVGDLDAAPLRPNSVDVCFCSMSIQYSADPALLMRRLYAVIHPGGYMCIRSGTKVTVASFEFLRFFPTALMAETRAMPQEGAISAWCQEVGLEVLISKMATMPAERTRMTLLHRVINRGFPSLQLVSLGEFACGVIRFACYLLLTWLRGTRLRGESVVLVVARRSEQ